MFIVQGTLSLDFARSLGNYDFRFRDAASFASPQGDNSRLRFRSLNDVQGSVINPHRPPAKPLMP